MQFKSIETSAAPGLLGPEIRRWVPTTDGNGLKLFFGFNLTGRTLCLQFSDQPSSFSFWMCSVFDLQLECASQICSALRPLLCGVEQLTLLWMSRCCDNGDTGRAMWRGLLRSFIGVTSLHICPGVLYGAIVDALELRGVGLDTGLLPSLQELSRNPSE